jgi:hypothetical protein
MQVAVSYPPRTYVFKQRQLLFFLVPKTALNECLYFVVFIALGAVKVNLKVKVTPCHVYACIAGKWLYICNTFVTPALHGCGWLAPPRRRFTPGKDQQYSTYSKLGGPRGWFGPALKITAPPGFYPRTAQSVASRYTDCAISAAWR